MKFCLPLAVFVLSLVLAATKSPAVASRGDIFRLHGTDYISLADWSRVKGMKWRWLKRDESFELANESARFQFAVDSRETSVNGLKVWLLFPLAPRNGEILISQLDADYTIRPLLSPPRTARAKNIRTICLDPGHGGKDPGNRVGSKQEKDFTLRLAFELRDQLRKAGFHVYLTRSSDSFVELPDRDAVARNRKTDLFVSLHFNATKVDRNHVEGPETY